MATAKHGDDQPGGAASGAERGDGRVGNPQQAIRDPDQWKTGDEPMTAAQRSYLSTLASEAGVEVPAELSKAEAAKQIDELQRRTGRGQPQQPAHSGSTST